MNTPEQHDPMHDLFHEYAEITLAATRPRAAAQLRRKAAHRRFGRTAVAGVAALTLAGSATWALQQNAAADEQATQQRAADEAPSPYEEDLERYQDMLGAAPDVVGAAIDLPPFVPGDADVDAVCGSAGTVLDGTHDEPADQGAVFLKHATTGTLAGDGGFWAEVGLFGCRYGEETLYQAVVLEEVADDTWEAREQIVHSVPGGESPQYLGSTDENGVIIGFAERYDPEANDVPYRAERVGFDAHGAPVREPLVELDGRGYADLSMRFTVTEAEAEGTWTVTLEIRNNGPRDVTDHVLHAAIDEEITIESGAPIDVIDSEDWTVLAEIHELEVGATYSQEWTVGVDDDMDDEIPPGFFADIEAVEPWEERPTLAQTVFWGQENAVYYFWE